MSQSNTEGTTTLPPLIITPEENTKDSHSLWNSGRVADFVNAYMASMMDIARAAGLDQSTIRSLENYARHTKTGFLNIVTIGVAVANHDWEGATKAAISIAVGAAVTAGATALATVLVSATVPTMALASIGIAASIGVEFLLRDVEVIATLADFVDSVGETIQDAIDWTSDTYTDLIDGLASFAEKIATDINVDLDSIIENLSRFADIVTNPRRNLINSIRGLFHSAEAHASPIILDLDGTGINTVGFDQDVYFDHDGNGFAQLTGWVGANDGLLVWDRNGNGVIDNGSELFGDSTVLANGLNAVNGFAALAEHDSNGDGIIDANDEIWPELRIWRDLSQDGITREGELVTLDELGITSINLSYTSSSYVDKHGDAHRQAGSFTWADGAEGIATDVWFAVDNARTRTIDLVDVPEELLALPEIQAFGHVHSLHQAMARDESGQLQALVTQFMEETNPLLREKLMTALLYEWAGVSGIDPQSRGAHVDARQLAALEAFLGEGFVQGNSPDPRTQAGQLLAQAFHELRTSLHAQLLAQTHLKTYIEGIQIGFDEEGLFLDFSAVHLMIEELSSSDPASAGIDMVYLDAYLSGHFGDAGWNATHSISKLVLEGHRSGWLYAPLREGDAGDLTLLEWLQEQRIASIANPGNQTLQGHDGRDVIIGHDEGVNRLYGHGGDDLLIAGRNDILYGGQGANILIAAVGAKLHGGTDSDTYKFQNTFDGSRIYASSTGEQGGDVAKFLDASPEDIWLRRDGNHLLIDVVSTGQSVTVMNWYSNDSRKLAAVHAGEYSATTVQLERLVSAMAEFSPASDGSLSSLPEDARQQLANEISASWTSAA